MRRLRRNALRDLLGGRDLMAKLTAKTRNAIPGKDFAGPDRSYPIEDVSHARNALSRASGKSVEGKVRAAVHRKYPSLGNSFDKG